MVEDCLAAISHLAEVGQYVCGIGQNLRNRPAQMIFYGLTIQLGEPLVDSEVAKIRPLENRDPDRQVQQDRVQVLLEHTRLFLGPLEVSEVRHQRMIPWPVGLCL